jgi:hypothetical protein
MPRLSLYQGHKSNNYKYIDKIISEMYQAGATDMHVHKYIGPAINPNSKDATQPVYDQLDPSNIQDLLFLENRDRKYDKDIYRLRGHYQVQNLDFDLSQFGLFLTNDILFITCHYNDMIDSIGRKLIVGDVIELPHLTDYHPLNDAIPTSLRRYYQVTDGNYASEGFSPTWLPHIWRIKCEPLVNSQEFSDILSQPNNKDNYLGSYDKSKTYPPGYTVSSGGKNYISTKEVPVSIKPPNDEYWKLDPNGSLNDILSTYNKNLLINDALIEEAKNQVGKSGYDTQNLYVVPTDTNNEPALPVAVIMESQGAPTPIYGQVEEIQTVGFKDGAYVARITRQSAQSLGLTPLNIISVFASQTLPTQTFSGSGPVSGDKVVSIDITGTSETVTFLFDENGRVQAPFGTADNLFASADADIDQSMFDEQINEAMDWTADCDPRFRYRAASSPKSFGYLDGYLTGDGTAPNGLPFAAGITFPANPKVGTYFLRTDYLPQVMFRWDGRLWVKISSNVRTGTGLGQDDRSQKGTFVNNSNVTILTNNTTTTEKQALSKILTIKADE